MPHVAFAQEYLFVRCPDKSCIALLNAKCIRLVTLTGENSVNPREICCFVMKIGLNSESLSLNFCWCSI